MPVIFNIHPDRDELSKLRSILNGRDFLVREFRSGADAEKELDKLPPNAVLMPPDITSSNGRPFIEVLNQRLPDCPIIMLVGKNQVMETVKMIGQNSIYDYFLLNPVIDPIRLHVILDKALTLSMVQMNLEDLKRRLQALPDNLPAAFDEQANNLMKEIGTRLEDFSKRMKSEEFRDVVKLLDEKKFDSELERFRREEINGAIEKSRQEVKDALISRLQNFSQHISEQIDNPIAIEKLMEFRRQLVGEDLREGLYDFDGKASSKTELLTGQKKKILMITEIDQPPSGLTAIIENGGYSVVIAQSPKKLMEIVRNNERIDMLVCGYNLGQINGFELIRDIWSKIKKTEFPIIIITTNPSKEIERIAREIGVSDVLTLPILPAILIKRIDSYLKAS
jgi:DNA-binding response OmpR family regulator/Skp family chaperone for outer membrane proteins